MADILAPINKPPPRLDRLTLAGHIHGSNIDASLLGESLGVISSKFEPTRNRLSISFLPGSNRLRQILKQKKI